MAKSTRKEVEVEIAFEGDGTSYGTDDDVMNVGLSASMSQAQQFMTGSQSTGQMLEAGITRSHQAQSVFLANTAQGYKQILGASHPEKQHHHGYEPKRMSKRLYRILSELKAAKKR